jgi:undecaprenyl phosphate-alpha-L-ara4N flippase subunit ArnE
MMSTLLPILAMVVASALGAGGQIMLSKLSGVPFRLMPFSLFAWGFATCYGVAVLINIWAYKAGLKPSIGYPIIALSYVFILLFSWYFFKESISGWSIAGVGFIVLGVSLIGWGAV